MKHTANRGENIVLMSEVMHCRRMEMLRVLGPESLRGVRDLPFDEVPLRPVLSRCRVTKYL